MPHQYHADECNTSWNFDARWISIVKWITADIPHRAIIIIIIMEQGNEIMNRAKTHVGIIRIFQKRPGNASSPIAVMLLMIDRHYNY